MTKLIKEMNDAIRPKDPIEEAFKKALNEMVEDATHLDEDQIFALADYMKEMIDGARKRGIEQSVEDAAGMALEDVVGFETAPKKVIQTTIEKLVRAYNSKNKPIG